MTRLRILLLEDNLHDAALVRELLEADNIACDIVRVQTRNDFLTALRDTEIGLILADYQLPSFDGLSALKLAQSDRPDLPFIFVSGTLGEEVAIEALKIGATDYVVKTRLSRLVPAVQRALREAHERAERRKAEEAREKAEEAVREKANLLDLTHDAIFVRDLDGVIDYWNRGAEALYGWTAEEAKGKTVLELLQTISSVPINQITVEVLDKGQWEGEFLRTRKDGTQVAVASRWSLQRDAHGVPVAAVETNNDITHRKRSEQEHERLRELEADLARLNRVSMMGELAGSLAHEIRQPLAAAVLSAGACVRWLRREVPEIAEARDAAAKMVGAVNLAADIIDRVSSLYRHGKPRRESVRLNEMIEEMTVLLGQTAKRNSVSFRTQLDRSLPETEGDRVQLQQVLLNLMLNGIEAMAGRGGELAVASKGTAEGLLISVSDSGGGLPVDGGERIFEAFYTTKAQGTGMGLSISRRIIEAHGGRLWAARNQAAGATFQFTLPLQHTPA